MKTIFILLTLGLMSVPVWSQDFSGEDQYSGADPGTLEEAEFIHPRGLPSSDYEEVERQEEALPGPVFLEEQTPEEIYEADEEYLE